MTVKMLCAICGKAIGQVACCNNAAYWLNLPPAPEDMEVSKMRRYKDFYLYVNMKSFKPKQRVIYPIGA